MAFANASFETADSGNPGLAQSWTLSVVSAIAIAGYAISGGLERAWDDFDDGWVSGYTFSLAPATSAQYSATFFLTTPAFEGFDVGWAPDQAALTTLGATATAPYNTTVDAFDGFDAEWGVASFETLLATMTTAAPTETFDSGWLASPFETSLGATSSAAFGATGGPFSFDDFESVFAPLTFVVTTSGVAVFTAIGHGMANGKRVLLRSTAHLPDGFAEDTYYFVISATTDTFQLAALSGGGALSTGTFGAGTHFVISDGVSDWGIVLS